jgi:hypothetical protein
MVHVLENLSETVRWRLMVNAAKKAIDADGYSMERVPGRGLSNIWAITKNGEAKIASIRTTRDRWIAFPPLEGGAKWKTLDDVDIVTVATVDSKENPENIEVYIFPADDVRMRFNAAYAARKENQQSVRDDFGMWVGLDLDKRGIASSVGSGIIDEYECVATYRIQDLLDEYQNQNEIVDVAVSKEVADAHSSYEPSTIAEVISFARDHISRLAGVPRDAVNLDLKIRY